MTGLLNSAFFSLSVISMFAGYEIKDERDIDIDQKLYPLWWSKLINFSFCLKKGRCLLGYFGWNRIRQFRYFFLMEIKQFHSFACPRWRIYVPIMYIVYVVMYIYIYIYRQTCVYMCRILFNRFCLLPTLSHENETVLSRNRHGNKKICCIYVLCKSIYHSCIILSF